MSEHLVIKPEAVCTPAGLKKGAAVVISDGRIESISTQPRAGGRVISAQGLYLLPGFADMHTHGMNLFEFTVGRFDPDSGRMIAQADTWQVGLRQYASDLASTGVTRAWPSLWAASIKDLHRPLDELKSYLAGGSNGRDGAFLVGANLEGTFINPQAAGAQNPEYLLEPDPAVFDRINRAGVIKLVNIVAEFDQKALALIQHVTKQGIVAGMGHTTATAEQVNRAVEAGSKYVVHMLNGPITSSYKPFYGGGAVEAALQNDALCVELISDTYHIAPHYLRDVIARKGAGQVMAITDQMFVTRCDKVDRFNISGVEGQVAENRQYVFVCGKPQVLYSSLLTMDRAFCNLLNLLTVPSQGVWTARHEAVDLAQAIADVSAMTSTNTCRLTGNGKMLGSIEQGKVADLVLLEIAGSPGKYQVAVRGTFVAGTEVFGQL